MGVTIIITTILLGLVGILILSPTSRFRKSLTMLAALSLAGIIGFTWVPDGGWSALKYLSFDPSRPLVQFSDTAGWFIGNWRTGQDGPLNVLLYIPAGLFLTLLTSHSVRGQVVTATSLGGLSLCTETGQALLGTRTGSLGDVGSNVLGALIGCALAAAVLHSTRVGRRFTHHRNRYTSHLGEPSMATSPATEKPNRSPGA